MLMYIRSVFPIIALDGSLYFVYILFIQLNPVLKLCAEIADCVQNVIYFMWCYVPSCNFVQFGWLLKCDYASKFFRMVSLCFIYLYQEII